ncbi:MAG: AAA family ATPase [Pirellulales bacterium]
MTFFPQIPTTLAEAGHTLWDLQSLILKHLFHRRTASGHEISKHLCLPFQIVEPVLGELKKERLIDFRGASGFGDFVYTILEDGAKRAREHLDESMYAGASPVPFDVYAKSVQLQSLDNCQPSADALNEALSDLMVDPGVFEKLGLALTAGRSVFLYGAPGNGKTSIAERVMNAYTDHIWIPKAVDVGRHVMRIYDSRYHKLVEVKDESMLRQVDRRWVAVRRPSIVVGGELTLDRLEVVETSRGVCEAPIQVKANCGAMVIDDFGRQRVEPHALLNRWIMPLDRRFDVLTLPNGRTVEVPFEQLTLFSTNLDPEELVDEAFLRRIPYKINVPSPREDEFIYLLKEACDGFVIAYNPDAAEYLLQRHFRDTGRAIRFCHPFDLVSLMDARCRFLDEPRQLTTKIIDACVATYFTSMLGPKKNVAREPVFSGCGN